MNDFNVAECPLCGAAMERMGGLTVWEHPGDDCPLAMIQIPLAALDGWNKRDALQAEIERLREAIERAARYVDGIRGAVETNQIADKDVRGVAIMVRDNLRQALHPDNEGGE